MQYCLGNPGARIVCIREVQNSLEQSVKRLIEDKIREFGVEDQFRILTKHVEAPGGGIIIFKGMQSYNADNIKSLESYDVGWVEEAQSLSTNSLSLLRPTLRKSNSELWFSWNPREKTDPVDALFRGEEPPPDAVSVQTSYRDNPYLPEVMLREIEYDQRRDKDRYAHVWLGKYRHLSEARVFKNWKVEEVGDAPPGSLRLYGGDFGFAVDPTVLMTCWFDPTRPRTLVFDHEVYEVGCEIEDTPDLWDTLFCDGLCPEDRKLCRRPMHGLVRGQKVVADSARPETISHLRRHGYPRIEGSVKGPNSVEEGIVFLQSYDIVVHPRCQHLIDELTYYEYKVDEKTGLVLPTLVDSKNHVIDSARYAVEPVRRTEERVKARVLW